VQSKYVAKIYFDEGEVAHENGDDLDGLYNWMLIKTQGKFGNFHGEIIDRKTSKVVRSFRKSPPD
jgi:hypothetical protein